MDRQADILKLINDNNGFEVTLGFINDVDHFAGGIKGGDNGVVNTVWYYIDKGAKTEFYLGRLLDDGSWEDTHFKKKGKEFIPSKTGSGTTINMIAERFFFGQDYIANDGRKPVQVENYGMTVDHYTYKFGELAYDISSEYGITVSHSDINDLSAGFRPRRINTGSLVIPPISNK